MERSEKVECPSCDGTGGFDAASDCEIYDEWVDCEDCGGTGYVEGEDEEG